MHFFTLHIYTQRPFLSSSQYKLLDLLQINPCPVPWQLDSEQHKRSHPAIRSRIKALTKRQLIIGEVEIPIARNRHYLLLAIIFPLPTKISLTSIYPTNSWIPREQRHCPILWVVKADFVLLHVASVYKTIAICFEAVAYTSLATVLHGSLCE